MVISNYLAPPNMTPDSTLQVVVLWLHLLFITVFPFTALFCLNKAIYSKLAEHLTIVRRWDTGQQQHCKKTELT